MTSPFLYFPDDVLSDAELRAARLDGDVVEIGDAFMPTDAVETRELRARTLLPLVGDRLALTHESAAWVHGALGDAPPRHSVQRFVSRRLPLPHDLRLRYRDLPLPPHDAQFIAGVAVTTPARTVIDLVRDRVLRGASDECVRALLAWDDRLVDEALGWFETAGPVHRKRAARDYLRSLRTR